MIRLNAKEFASWKKKGFFDEAKDVPKKAPQRKKAKKATAAKRSQR